MAAGTPAAEQRAASEKPALGSAPVPRARITGLMPGATKATAGINAGGAALRLPAGDTGVGPTRASAVGRGCAARSGTHRCPTLRSVSFCWAVVRAAPESFRNNLISSISKVTPRIGAEQIDPCCDRLDRRQIDMVPGSREFLACLFERGATRAALGVDVACRCRVSRLGSLRGLAPRPDGLYGLSSPASAPRRSPSDRATPAGTPAEPIRGSWNPLRWSTTTISTASMRTSGRSS
jgi:hypothetical protein